MKSIRTWLVLTISLAMTGTQAVAKGIPGLAGGNRTWVAMLIEDHKGMQEVVWDSAFADLQAVGPFLKDHSYVIRTGSKPSLMDLGCWDATGARGGECHHLTASYTLAWTKDRKGVLLRSGTHATWLPALGGFEGDKFPNTFRGAYLNWLLSNRSTTPSIPSESRWQRVQRGALTVAAQLFSEGGGKPAYRLVGVGTSGHLLIPPGESLNAIQHEIRKMHPRTHDGEGGHGKDDDHDRDDDCDRDGSMLKALRRVYESMAHAKGLDRDREQHGSDGDHHANDGDRHDKGGNGQDGGEDHHGDSDHDDDHDHHGGGQSNDCGFSIVLPISDGIAFGRTCGSARAYEALSSYPDMLQAAGNIAATGQAVVWSWNVEGPGTWNKAFAAKGQGQAFEGDAVEGLLSAVKTWMAQKGTAPAVTLALSNPVLTRIPEEVLTVTLSGAASSATLNGQPLTLTGLSTSVPLTLVEGVNTFTVTVESPCGSTQASIGVVLDRIAPLVALQSPAEGWRTNAAAVTLAGSVNDPTALLTVNGQALAQTVGAFTALFTPAEGPFVMTVVATDPAGNSSSVVRTIVLDRTAPKITLMRSVPALVAVTSLTLQGTVDDPSARLTLNGAALTLDTQGAFTVEAPLSEGANAFHFEASDLTGNVGVLDARTVRDTTPPVVSLDAPQDGFITNQRTLLVKGRVDDPTARLLVAGQSLSPVADGSFEITLSPVEGPLMLVALATDPAGNTGHVVRSVTLDWTPPQLAWSAPTPAEGAKVSALPVAVAATVSEHATVLLNGQPLTQESGAPFLVKSSLSPAEGPVTLSLEATDRAGNTTRIERHFDLGLTAPKLVIESPAEGLQTQEASAVLAGRVEGGDFLKPLTLTMNGHAVSLAADGRFTLPVQLLEGANPFSFTATNAFGLQALAARTLNRFTTPFGVQIDWPMEGLAIPESSVEVLGRVRRAGTTVVVNGIPAPVEPGTLVFKVVVPLQPGPNTLWAQATDGAGNQGEAQVRVICAPPADPAATYRWDLPANVSTSRTRMVRVQGQADLPGVASVKVNGLPMSLSGLGKVGKFEGDVPLDTKGRNVLFLEVRTLAGATLTERREVSFVPELPRIHLQAPETARPGDSIPIQVSPEPGTRLNGADVSWNGRFLARVTDPFAALSAQVPGDAAVGSRILVEALATDIEGEQVTARTYVTVYGQGALLVEAYDDQQGLPLKEGLAAVEGGEAQTLNTTGKAALRTALPQNWIQVSRNGSTPVWRPAGLQVGGVMAAVDARLTPLAEAQPVTPGAFAGRFGQGALELTFPAGTFTAEGPLSATPLSTQGLPGLLPAGWSAVSAWWVDLGTLRPAYPGAASLTLPVAASLENLVWARWDQGLHVWIALATGLRAAELKDLAITGPGGFALVIPDTGATAPPAALSGAQLPAFEGVAWREGLLASGTVDPAILPTTAAIRGARATAKFSLGFADKEPIPSGAIVQVDVLESYALLDAALIEPDGFTQDAVLAHWILGVDKDGAPTLKAAQDLGLELPVRMSRSFQENELVDGRIWVGFYHDGVQVAQSGSELVDASGGVVSHDGIQLTLPSHALTGTTLIRLNADQGDLTSLWPELAGQGSLVKSFQLDIVGTVSQGFGLSFDELGSVPDTAQPLLVARRVIQGERLVVALGGLQKQGSRWTLVVPEGGNPVLEGGAFAVLVPALTWDWISGTALLPGSIAQPLMQKLGPKARMVSLKELNRPVRNSGNGENAKAGSPGHALTTPHRSSSAKPSSLSSSSSPDDVAVADVVVTGGFLQSVSGATGAFAVPAIIPADSSNIPVKGARRDLGVTGSFTAPAPSAGNALRLSQVPFRVMTIAPADMAEVGVGTVVEVQLSTAADPATLGQVKLYQEVTAAAVQTPVAPAQGQKVRGQTPGNHTKPVATRSKPAAASAKPAPKKAKRNATRPAQKNAMQATDVPQLVEVTLRRTLSQDGRMLLLTPEAPLQLGAVYRVVTMGLASSSGEAAPAFTRRFKTQSQPQFPDVDFSRIKLSYPTEAFDVTVTIPEGAVPPWSIVSVEAPDMGSFGQGVMPPMGDLVFPLKASLGERLRVMIQLRDGRSLSGTIGRYVADDGRTTLGADGGRVEGPGGLAIVVPAGALETSAELRVVASTDIPQPTEGALLNGEQLTAALELQSKDPISFKTPPILELPLSAVPAGMMTTVDTEATFGNGPVPVYQKVVTKLPDGTEDFSYVLMDTAQLSGDGKKLQTAGGLRVPDPLLGTVVQAQPVRMTRKQAVPAQTTQPRGQEAKTTIGTQELGSYGGYDGYSVGFFTMWIPIAVYEPQYLYHSGSVYRNWNGSGRCGGTASADCYGELGSAEVHRYSGTMGLDAARKGRLSRGRLLTVCDSHGRYINVGGPITGAIPGQTWVSLFAVDPRTGETSIDGGSPSATDLGLPDTRRDHSIAITSQGGNPFDPTLTAPRIRATILDANDTAQTMFTVGSIGKLRIKTETGSQPVVQGKVSGSVTQDFGSLPADIPVTFTQEGTWKVDILGWTAKPVQGAASLSVVVTPVGVLGPSLPGKPTILHKDPSDGDKDVDPSSVIKITFSEPVRGATASAFGMEVNNAKVPFRVISNAREVVDASTLVQEVWLMPDQRLSLGGTVTATLVSSLIVDQDAMSPDPASWTFTVRGADEVGSLADVGTFSQMVVHKGKIYAAEDVGAGYYFDGAIFQVDAGMRKQGVRVIDATDPSNPTKGPIFGEFRSWDPPTPEHLNLSLTQGPFSKSSISGLRVATGVSIGGRTRDVLLVATRPWSVREILAMLDPEYGGTIYRIRHNALWAFDITDDADATEVSMGNTIPKLLMATSQGTMSENWVKGLGGAGGVLGSIKLNGGMTMWDANQWQDSWEQDKATLSDWTIRYRTAGGTGYYPNPQSLVASNGFYDASGASQPSVTSAVVTDDANGRPIGFATMGYSTGYLMAIDGKVGEPMAKATYSSGGPYGMDSRLHDLSATVNNEPANAVEVMKGNWQGPGGTEQGTLLLVGTTGHFWVLKPDTSNMTNPSAAQYALATLPGRIVRILPDPARMLVGVEAGGRAYIFDLKNLQPTSIGPMTLTPIYDFVLSGAWTIQNGLLYWERALNQPSNKLTINRIDAQKIEPMVGLPIRADINQVLAGLFMNYNKKILNNSDGVPVLKPDSALTYRMVRAYGQNRGYPWLRYYYPDLGPMVITGMVEQTDPSIFIEMTSIDPVKPSPWFMEAEAVLIGPNGPIPNAVDVQAMKIVRGDQTDRADLLGTNRSPIYGDGERARLELEAETVATPVPVDLSQYRDQKFAYAPFQFSINPETVARLDQELRRDEQETYRVQITLKLYKGTEQRTRGESEGFAKPYEYSVKFNSNTRLFDIARGGVWTFDPSVSGGDPFDTGQNPNTAAWFDVLKSDQGYTRDQLTQAFQGRLSLTPFREVLDAGAVSVPGATQEFKLSEMGLDMTQACLDQALVGLRQQVIKDGDKSRNLPMPLAYRGTILQPDEGASLGQQALKGDMPGAYGYRTTHAVNAIQELSAKDMGSTDARTLGSPGRWQADPGIFKSEATRGVNARIMPMVSQGLRKKDGTWNSGNTLVHYLVAYPNLAKQGTPDNGLFPISTVLTRDLVFGPTPDWTDLDVQYWASKQSVDLVTYQAQREQVDTLLQTINVLPGRSDTAFDSSKVEDLFGQLKDSLLKQDIIIDRGSAVWSGTGRFFNGAIGIVQLGLQTNWDRRRMDQVWPGSYVPNANAHILEVAEAAPAAVSDECRSTPEYRAIYRKVFDFLMCHPHSRRLDVYLNGVANLPTELEESADRLQKKLLELEFPDAGERALKADQVPVLGIYNTSSKLFYGGTDPWWEKFDLNDFLNQKRETAMPWWPANDDTRRLVATLTAATDILWNDVGFIESFMAANRDPLDPDSALNALKRLRSRLTLHAHSQGALISASAQYRLGTFRIDMPDVKARISRVWGLVTYGGAANMYDFGTDPYYKTYTHHVNERDAVPFAFGMADPFQKGLGTFSALLHASGPMAANLPVIGPKLLMHPHFIAISLPTTSGMRQAYLQDHQVILFKSHCPTPNINEHNFLNGYLCHIGMNPDGLPCFINNQWTNEKSGGEFCILPAPGADPWIDCSR